MSIHEIDIRKSVGRNVYGGNANTETYRAACSCKWEGSYYNQSQEGARRDGQAHLDRMVTVDPDAMSIYDVLLELIEMQPWRDESSKMRRVKAVQVAKQNALFGAEGNYKL